MTADDPLAAYQARETQSLARHLEGVASGAAALTDEWGQTPYGEEWSTVAHSLAWTHDFGKLTPWFQEYLETDSRSEAPSRRHTFHGGVSALLSLWVLQELECSPQTIAAGFIAVAKHHGVLPNLKHEFERYRQSDRVTKQQHVAVLAEQLEKIDVECAPAADQLLQAATDGSLRWKAINETEISEYLNFLNQLEAELFSNRSADDAADQFYAYTEAVWSTLVTADKSDASELTTPETTANLGTVDRPDVTKLTQAVDRLASTTLPNGSESRWYRQHPDAALPSSSATTGQRVAAIQTAANARATQTIEASPDQYVFELTLPTGFGKTYSGLRAAMTRADNRDSRVIYALPYTSIIDQVDSEIQSVFDVTPHSTAYTKHHHLADTRTAANQLAGESYGTGRETLHAEAWRSGLVVTTFTQLFESLAGPGNVQSVKLPALHDSVIVIDEPQAAPLSWWNLIGQLIKSCVELYDATVILMTATQPRFLRQLADCPTPEPLVDMADEYTAVLEDSPRVQFTLHDSLLDYFTGASQPLGIPDAAEAVRAETAAGTNTLSIVNTVDCAVGMTEALTESTTLALGDSLLAYQRATDDEERSAAGYLRYLDAHTDGYELLTATLTTRLRPKDRSLLLDALSKIIDDESTTPFDDLPTITISTQLIEAGVDISFDRLFRDFAPLPAIVQAAGRCNRSFGGSTRTVTIWRLDSPAGCEYVPSKLIYGDDSLLRPTRTVLQSLRDERTTAEIPEAALINSGIKSFYETLHTQRQTDAVTDPLVDAFHSGNGEYLRSVSLIDDDYETVDVAVLVTDAEREEFEAYLNAKEDGRWTAATSNFQALQSCITTIPVSEDDTDDDLRPFTPASQADGYDITTGGGVRIESVVFDTEV